jgi:hypothetical protein
VAVNFSDFRTAIRLLHQIIGNLPPTGSDVTSVQRVGTLDLCLVGATTTNVPAVSIYLPISGRNVHP